MKRSTTSFFKNARSIRGFRTSQFLNKDKQTSGTTVTPQESEFKFSPTIVLGKKQKLVRLVNAGEEYEKEQAAVLEQMINDGLVKPEFEVSDEGHLVYETTEQYEEVLVKGLNTLQQGMKDRPTSDPLYDIQQESVDNLGYDITGTLNPEDEQVMSAARYHIRLVKRVKQLAKLAQEGQPEEWYDAPFVRLHKTHPAPVDEEMDIAHENSQGTWLDGASKFMMTKGKDREEVLNPRLFADHLPDLVDISKGYGLSLHNPIIVQSHGEDERVVGCFGNCGHPDVDLYDDITTLKWWACPANAYTMCAECGLYFYCAGPEFIAHLNVNTMIRMNPEVRREFIELHVSQLVEQGEVKKEEAQALIDDEEEIIAYNIQLLDMLRNMMYNEHCTQEEAREAWKSTYQHSQLNIPELQTHL